MELQKHYLNIKDDVPNCPVLCDIVDHFITILVRINIEVENKTYLTKDSKMSCQNIDYDHFCLKTATDTDKLKDLAATTENQEMEVESTNSDSDNCLNINEYGTYLDEEKPRHHRTRKSNRYVMLSKKGETTPIPRKRTRRRNSDRISERRPNSRFHRNHRRERDSTKCKINKKFSKYPQFYFTPGIGT